MSWSVVSPNFDANPDDFSHFPDPFDWSRIRNPIFGRISSSRASSRICSTSNGFSTTTTTCFPRRVAREADER